MRMMPKTKGYPPQPPRLSISGAVRRFLFDIVCANDHLHVLSQAGQAKSDRDFLFDIQNYVAGSVRVAGHICHFPSTVKRYENRPPLPTERKFINVVGYVNGRSVESNGENPVKRLNIEIREFSFIGIDTPKSVLSKPNGQSAISSSTFRT
jgi:hypothetical protein